jgi:hypothetical protein
MRKRNTRLIQTAAAVSFIVAAIDAAADWKGDIARSAVGRVVREGLEEAIEDAAVDRALDAATEAGVYVAPRLRHIDDLADVADDVGDGIETAMRVADVARETR